MLKRGGAPNQRLGKIASGVTNQRFTLNIHDVINLRIHSPLPLPSRKKGEKFFVQATDLLGSENTATKTIK